MPFSKMYGSKNGPKKNLTKKSLVTLKYKKNIMGLLIKIKSYQMKIEQFPNNLKFCF